ncbi:Inner membrane transport protein ydhC [Raoultella terrigena]|uniref:Inner membrane transport protein ydhC n=1 Tax=Raoultella terrigena TaxID=577 RepID=A0A4U9CXI1_RAOTE|nr:Inner membrane transport protein ydhC [Raoultella terrigena]
MLAGIAVYALGCAMALAVTDFRLLLLARIVAAFGAAVGSVVSQTILRDRFSGRRLAGLFSLIGLALAVSPAAGVWVGGLLAAGWGMRGVFLALALLAGVLLLLCGWLLPETRPARQANAAFLPVLRRMAADRQIGLAVILVAAFNVSLFSYYSLAPFIFAELRLPVAAFGYSGMALAGGSLAGALLNRRLLHRGVTQGGCCCLPAGSIWPAARRLYLWRDSLWFLLPMAGVALAFAMAIPLVLGSALGAYSDCRGTAGAIFGLGLLSADWPRAGAGRLGAIAGGVAGGLCRARRHRRYPLFTLFRRKERGRRLGHPRQLVLLRQPPAAGGIEEMDFLAPGSEIQRLLEPGVNASGDLHVNRESLPIEMQQGGLPGDLHNFDRSGQAVGVRLDILRTQADGDRRASLRRRRPIPAFRQRQPQLAAAHAGNAVAAGYLSRQQVHRRRADKAGHKGVAGAIVNLQRRPLLDDKPLAHHHDLIGQGHGLNLIVGNVNHGGLKALVQRLDLRRSSMRSWASRLESGSSNRKTCGLRTIARPIATRWRWPRKARAGSGPAAYRFPAGWRYAGLCFSASLYRPF